MAATGAAAIEAAARAMLEALAGGNSILVFGNGGSAADAHHFIAELVIRYEKDRPARAAVALTTDSSVVTAAGNDLGFERLFARQIEALGRAGDVALAITTSGNSPNVVRALEVANARGLVTIALTGRDGGTAGKAAAIHGQVAEPRTGREQGVQSTRPAGVSRLVGE